MSRANETSTSPWREKLSEWLSKNPRTMPEDLRRLRDEFVRRFPKEKLGELTLEQYALGHENSRDSFCYWLEFKTKKLGHMGGDARKFGVWWDKNEGRWRWNRIYESAEDALTKIKDGLSAIVEAAGQGRFGELDRIGEERIGQSRYGLRCKPLSIYFPDEVLPVWQPEHIRHFLKILGAEPSGEVLALNRQLLRLLRGLPELEGFDALQATLFLYDSFPPPGVSEASADTSRTRPKASEATPPKLQELLNVTTRTRNVLLYGPPGTGKTWLVNHFTNYFLLLHNSSQADADDYWRKRGAGGRRAGGEYSEFVTFHQSFAYEEFVEGLRPVPDEKTGGVSYRVVPGVFRRICERARAAWEADPENAPRYLLVIDEINRANIAKVLGELITLLEDDKRLGEANAVTLTLPYSGGRFGVPPNLYVLGTMNTADRSIALLDLALRRRFAFVEMEPDPAAVEPAEVEGVDLRALLGRLNGRVAALLDRDHRVGHSYFMNLRGAEDLRFAWYARVVPLLEEYFYNDHERLRAALGPRFVRPARADAVTRAALGDFADAERVPHEIARLEGEEFLGALRELAGGAAPVEEA